MGSVMRKYRRYKLTTEPITTKTDRIFRRHTTYSIRRIESGMNVGQSTWEKTEKMYVMTVCRADDWEESQITPSVSCWIPKSNGIVAKRISSLLFSLLIVTPPTALRAVPAVKLAVAEKHIRRFRKWNELIPFGGGHVSPSFRRF